MRKVEEILISMIEPGNMSLSSSELTEFLNASFNDGENKEAIRQAKLK